MKRMTPLFLFFLCSCAKIEVTLPSCDFIEATREGSNVHMKVHSTSDHITIRHDWGFTQTVYRAYFGCITTGIDVGEVLTIEDDNTICEVNVR
jgi:hypothetical protein